MKWFLELDVFKGEGSNIIETLREMNVEYEECSFGIPYEQIASKLRSSFEEYIFYGSFQLATLLKNNKNCHVMCNTDQYDCTYYYPKFMWDLANQSYQIVPLGEVWSQDLVNESVFIKPCAFKQFTGAPLTKELLQLLKLRFDPNTLVVVAPQLQVEQEWRLVIADNQVITGSQYKPASPNVPKEVIDYAHDILTTVEYCPDPVWVLDICRVNDQFRVLEVGPLSCSGLYRCDMKKVVSATTFNVLWATCK